MAGDGVFVVEKFCMRRFLAILAFFAVLGPVAVSAQPIVDGKFGAYLKYDSANIRIDKVESVRHIDGNPILGDNCGGMQCDSDSGYLIVSVSVQNPGAAEIFMPTFGSVLYLEDQSKVESDIHGPYVGAKTVDAPARLASKESIRVRYVIPDWPGTRITKFVLTGAQPNRRFQIGPNDITPIAEIPKPKPTE